MHDIQAFSYLGVGMIAFILSGIFIKCMSYFCNRVINRQSQAAASALSAQSAAAGRNAYREVVIETSASRVEVVVEEAACSCSCGNDSDGNNFERKECQNYNCIICMCEVEDGDVCWELHACNHRFHADCIRKWMKKNKSCPLCRTAIIVPSS